MRVARVACHLTDGCGLTVWDLDSLRGFQCQPKAFMIPSRCLLAHHATAAAVPIQNRVKPKLDVLHDLKKSLQIVWTDSIKDYGTVHLLFVA